eukprot:6203941-Pleurochrysis_carterae.AAC.3
MCVPAVPRLRVPPAGLWYCEPVGRVLHRLIGARFGLHHDESISRRGRRLALRRLAISTIIMVSVVIAVIITFAI